MKKTKRVRSCVGFYPENDTQFETSTITEVNRCADGGWSIKREDGWSYYVPASSPIEPKAGMLARLYGKGIGYLVRGLFLDGKQVFYRTAQEDERYHEEMVYGKDAVDWLARWDAGQIVWSIEMGGLGPSYEQAVQITIAEILRHLLEQKYDVTRWESEDQWKEDRAAIEAAGFANQQITDLGLSGAMWGAALSLALQLYRHGPIAVMKDERVKDRQIQVCRNFPNGGVK